MTVSYPLARCRFTNFPQVSSIRRCISRGSAGPGIDLTLGHATHVLRMAHCGTIGLLVTAGSDFDEDRYMHIVTLFTRLLPKE